jgi:hypothetical protein
LVGVGPAGVIPPPPPPPQKDITRARGGARNTCRVYAGKDGSN